MFFVLFCFVLFFVCNISLKSEKDKNSKELISKKVGEFRNRRNENNVGINERNVGERRYVGVINGMSE